MCILLASIFHMIIHIFCLNRKRTISVENWGVTAEFEPMMFCSVVQFAINTVIQALWCMNSHVGDLPRASEHLRSRWQTGVHMHGSNMIGYARAFKAWHLYAHKVEIAFVLNGCTIVDLHVRTCHLQISWIHNVCSRNQECTKNDDLGCLRMGNVILGLCKNQRVSKHSLQSFITRLEIKNNKYYNLNIFASEACLFPLLRSPGLSPTTFGSGFGITLVMKLFSIRKLSRPSIKRCWLAKGPPNMVGEAEFVA